MTRMLQNGDDQDHLRDLILRVNDVDTVIEFGPEQLVARIPVKPVSSDDDDDGDDDDDDDDENNMTNTPPTKFRALVTFSDDLWQQTQQTTIM